MSKIIEYIMEPTTVKTCYRLEYPESPYVELSDDSIVNMNEKHIKVKIGLDVIGSARIIVENCKNDTKTTINIPAELVRVITAFHDVMKD